MLGAIRPFAVLAVALLGGSVAQAQSPQPCLIEDGDATLLVGPRVTRINVEYAVRLRNGATPLDVTAVEIFTGLRRGDTSIGLHRHDPSADLPGAPFVFGGWWQSEAVGWQGARFPFSARIQPGEVFWLVWRAATGSQLPVARVDRVGGDVHRTRQNFTQGSWSASRREWDWKVRIDCGGRWPGQLLTDGAPCSGGGIAPQLRTVQPVPVIGNVFELSVGNTRPGSTAWLGFSTGGRTWAGLNLPADLTRFGAPGCVVGANLESGVVRQTDGAGAASVPLGIPGQPGLVGVTFYAQWVSLDAQANALGVLTSLTAQARIGN